ncbi:hypothetical protein E9531_13620 [Lampropedia puyangensis]|uniref:Uncharacterized protein n=1 Tax=Lampropedia puyangensis TaxID=1330072 RepID=A0A4S8EW50_9BURK|nr:SMR family transporter [Lampropedia puyangensis]THT98718.1 hypothetical protein E9531_13620 [Lampropedia puyangensis]
MVISTLIFGAFCSTLGTLALKGSEQFRKPAPTILAFLCYAGSTILLARAITLMPIALAHAVWTGLVALALLAIDRWVFHLALSASRVAGFFCVLAGIAVLGVWA